MAQITDYDTLSAAINSWDERTHDVDELIGLAEGEFRLYFGPNYTKETTGTLTFTAGVAAIPAGYIRPVAMSHATGGPLTQVSWDALNTYNPMGLSGIPTLYALSGSQIKTAPLHDGDLTFTYEGTLAGLSGSNATNWLITNAPQAYLSMCMSFAKAKFEDYPNAALLKSAAFQTLGDLGIQSTVAQYGKASMTIRGATP
jgi:hypothetical protein